MLIETNASLYNVESFHSNKTNKDYHRCGLLIEGVPAQMFIDEKPYNELVKQPFFNAVAVEHNPTPVVVKLEIRFTEKGCTAYLRSVTSPNKKG